MKSLVGSLSLALLLGSVSMPALAGNFFEEVGKVVTAPIRGQIRLGEDISKGRPVGEIINNQIKTQVQQPAQAAGQVINHVQKAHNFIMNVPRDAISRNLGPGWRDAFDTLTASDRLQQEIAFTSGRYLSGCVGTGQCGMDQLTAVPVAAAMRDAYKVYAPRATPLPPQLVSHLSSVVPVNLLMAARWTVGNVPNLTVPGFLNAANEAVGNGFAVTLGNVMIFSRAPDPRTDIEWILHELFHIEQYARFSNDYLESIDGFAVQYIKHFQSLESEAQNAAEQRAALLPQYYSMR